MSQTTGFSIKSHANAEKEARMLLEQMTQEEKIRTLGGVRGFFIPSCERLGISEVSMSDASCGVNIRDVWLEERVDTDLERSLAFPCFIALASTWNTELCGSYAQSVGEECRAGGVHILLGPGMNIYRHAQCGRNFEYLGEDPFLAAQMIENYVQSLQSTGVAATLKHFIANNSDFFRRKSNSLVRERALREIYMPAFQAGINAGAMAVMTSYNLLNGEWSSQNAYLITEVLKNEMGFKWLVMTDWWAIHGCEEAVLSGLDLEMPATEVFKDIPRLLSKGKISVADIDRMVLSILKTSIAMNFYDPQYQQKELLANYPEHEKIALQTARESVVLLKNTSNILPLEGTETVLLTGRFVEEIAGGGGAAEVLGYDRVSLLDALKKELGDRLLYKEDPTDAELQAADLLIVSTGTLDKEGCDRAFALPAAEEERVKRAVGLNSRTVVVVNSGSGIRMTDWNNAAAAILYCWYGGQVGNRALAEILCGKTNPSGKLPISIEKEFSDSPGANYLPEGEVLYEGWNDEVEKTRPIYDIDYAEGIFVGYRWYDQKNIEVLYPFGHGLSYTSFAYSDIQLSANSANSANSRALSAAKPQTLSPAKPQTLSATQINAGKAVEVRITVKNTGDRAGKETVQVYVRDDHSSHPRPKKELKGFAKVMLSPGETQTLTLSLGQKAFQFWNPSTRSWTIEPGTFTIYAGSSSANLPLSTSLRLG